MIFRGTQDLKERFISRNQLKVLLLYVLKMHHFVVFGAFLVRYFLAAMKIDVQTTVSRIFYYGIVCGKP